MDSIGKIIQVTSCDLEDTFLLLTDTGKLFLGSFESNGLNYTQLQTPDEVKHDLVPKQFVARTEEANEINKENIGVING